MSVAFVNGAPQGILWHDKDNWTMYVSPYMVVNSDRFTKHYYAGSQRIASKIGAGEFNNLYDASKACVTAGQKDYAERMNLITQSRNDYYAALGIPPGPPTAKGIYGEAEYSGAYGDYSLEPLGNYDVPTGWPMKPYKRPYGGTPGPPVMYEKPSDPEEEGAGYGYTNAENIQEKDIYFYHSDHLGSISYITDKDGNATQFVCYKPYGEALVDEHNTSYEQPWKFNGKELDSETGLYYYGARYYEASLTAWYGVDALAEKYPNMGGYVYCAGNPVRLVDPDGEKVIAHDKESQISILKTLPEQMRQYVSFNREGVMNISDCTMFECSDSYNANSLYLLYSDEQIINFHTAECADDGNGNTYNMVGDDENGTKGITLMPSVEESLSPDSEIHIYTSSKLSLFRRAKNTAHEGYGHALSFILGEDPMHRYEGTLVDLGNGEWGIGRKETNEQLSQRITTAEDETKTNY